MSAENHATRTPRPWVILAVSVLVAAASSAVTAGTAFLLPALHVDRGLSLPVAGLLVAMPNIGTAATLIAWGWFVDRTGERLALTLGALASAGALVGAMLTHSLLLTGLFFLLAGAACASANSASGRLVIGWFPAHRRGLAMGIRQMSQPLGTAVAALTMPLLARTHGIPTALDVPLALSLLGAVAVWLLAVDPPRPERGGAATHLEASPYRGARYLWRIHGVSVLLVVPQALMQAYLLVWLVVGHGWEPGRAGLVVTASQLLGAAGRIVVGAWSDRLASRMRALRAVAVTGAAASATLATAELLGAPGSVAVTLAVCVAVVTVADNGLAFTAIAEYAGPFWSGRALGAQNTGQFLAISASTPLAAVLIDQAGYAGAFAASALLAAVAVPLVPRADRER